MPKAKDEVIATVATDDPVALPTLFMEDDNYVYIVEGERALSLTTHEQVQILKVTGSLGPGVYRDLDPKITVTVTLRGLDAEPTQET